MNSLERISDMLNGRNRRILCQNRDKVAEIRLRPGRELRLKLIDGQEIEGEVLDIRDFQRIIGRLMDNSMYSRENELKQGFFTTLDGFRIGVCGKVNAGAIGIDSLVNIGSACVRVPREVLGCSSEIVKIVRQTKRYSILIVSPPGLGKTTIIRDYIRTLSDEGMNVCLADERREIACCTEGIPQLQVGNRTDVLDGCPKSLAMNMMIRSCSPDMVAADEIGTHADAEALLEASRCGVSVAATVHGYSMKDLLKREHIAALIKSGVFDWCVFLGPGRGHIQKILPLSEEVGGKVSDAQRIIAGDDTAGLYLCWTDAFQCAPEKV